MAKIFTLSTLIILALCPWAPAKADNTISICVPTISTATGVSVTSCVPVSIAAPFPTKSN